MKMLFKNWSDFLIMALSSSLSLSCFGYNCTIGKELCSCEYVDCKNYKKNLEYCDKDDYKESICDKSENYVYTDAFCNLTSVACVEKTKGEYVPDFSIFLGRKEKYNFSIHYKVIPILNNSWFRNLNISSLEISYNHIKKIDENALVDVHGLKELNISINLLQEIKLNNLPDLEILDARRNVLKKIDSSSFSLTPKLKILYLKYNDIKFITSDAFNFNPELRTFDVKSNYLTELNTFPVMNFLLSINLEDNELSEIRNGTFKNVKSLKTLRIGNNNIEKVEANAFVGLEELRKIRIVSNKFKNVIKLNDSLKLMYIAMSVNLIKKLDRNSFSSFKSLSIIKFPMNEIS
jgi:hypothetical protein